MVEHREIETTRKDLSTTWADYHSLHNARMYSTDYSKHSKMKYHQETHDVNASEEHFQKPALPTKIENDVYEEKKASALYDAPLPGSYPPPSWADYHGSRNSRMCPPDYSTLSSHMPYNPEHRRDYASTDYSQHAMLPRKSRKRPSSEFPDSSQSSRPKYEDASHGNNGLNTNQKTNYHDPYANRNHYQGNIPFSHAHSSAMPIKSSLENPHMDPAAWSDAKASQPSYYAPHPINPLPPRLLPNSSTFGYGAPTGPHTRPNSSYAPHNYNFYGQVPLPQHLDQGVVQSQGTALYQKHQFSQPSRSILTLAMGEDENWLSEFLCFVRGHCTEVVCASQQDVISRMNSKKVLQGQVGIRCQFCSHLPHKKRGGRSSTFPSSLSRIYQSLTMMIRDHFESCPAMPSESKTKFKELRGSVSQGVVGSKQYWIHSAKALGLVDTDSGIFFIDRRYFASKQT
mmetsp:Transcript_17020/g.24973  ORF Transcript_17020/g.24973 Transcript_17020/m.24973 type:complete len:456 (-) Transcript_17020:276-1643(-)